MTNKKQQLTAELAWTLIAQMGWSKQADYKAIAQTFFKKLGKSGMKKLDQFVGDRVSQLGTAVANYERETGKSLEVGSDDGFSDLRYHIVGMGQEIFDEALRDPQVMQTRSRQGNYKESFAYCFMQPDPPRTAKQKEATFEKLMAEIGRMNTRLDALNEYAVLIRMHSQSISLLAAAVANDRKSA